MTSKLKCPICGGEMIGNMGSPICHYNQDCPIHDRSIPLEVYDLLDRTRKALDYCIKMFKSLENVLDEKVEASDIPDNPDLYAWAVRIKPIWGELKEITGIDYITEHK